MSPHLKIPLSTAGIPFAYRYHPVGGNDDDFQDFRKAQPVPKATNLEIPPKVAFSMLKNKEVQAKLSFYGLPTDGKRQVHLSIFRN